MPTVLLEKLFGFTVTVVIGFSEFSNGQTTKEIEMVPAFMFFDVVQKLFIIDWIINVFLSWIFGRRDWVLM